MFVSLTFIYTIGNHCFKNLRGCYIHAAWIKIFIHHSSVYPNREAITADNPLLFCCTANLDHTVYAENLAIWRLDLKSKIRQQ